MGGEPIVGRLGRPLQPKEMVAAREGIPDVN